MNAIEVSEICKTYGGFRLGPISFEVPEGCIVGCLGDNGAGKTTIIRSILDLLNTDSGQVRIFGKEHERDDVTWREEVGVVLDTCRFPDNLTAADIGGIMGNLYKKWHQDTYESYLRRFNVPSGKRVKELSRGMGMKLTLAAALSHEAKILILDEATGGLDPVVRSELLDLFLEFVQEEDHSIFMSSHITADLTKVADYVMVLHEGQIILYENKDTLLYEYGVVKCSKGQVEMLDKNMILGSRENRYDVEVLVKDNTIPLPEGAVMDRLDLDELLVYLIGKGGSAL